jgi:hypothetical protein
MKISTMIIVALAALIAVVPATATSDETFGQVFNLDDVAVVESSRNLKLSCEMLMASSCNKLSVCKYCKDIKKCIPRVRRC